MNIRSSASQTALSSLRDQARSGLDQRLQSTCPLPDLVEIEKRLICEAFALTERWNANAAKYWARRENDDV